MKNKKKSKSIAALIIFLISITVIAFMLTSNFLEQKDKSSGTADPNTDIQDITVQDNTSSVIQADGTKKTTELYFPTMDNSAVRMEKRDLQVEGGAVMRAAVLALLEGPQGSELRKAMPDGTKLIGIKREDNVAIVDFSSEYAKAGGISEIVEMISVVNTLTKISGIEKVKVLVGGKDMIAPSGMVYGELPRYALDDDGYPVPGETKTITIYFANSNADKVVAEKRDICVPEGKLLEKVILEELVEGPQTKGLLPTIPEGTKFLSVKTENKICIVDLSEEFITNSPGGSASESMTLCSIVNSLTELPGVGKVQFLINGQAREAYIHVIFDQPFSRSEDMIQK